MRWRGVKPVVFVVLVVGAIIVWLAQPTAISRAPVDLSGPSSVLVGGSVVVEATTSGAAVSLLVVSGSGESVVVVHITNGVGALTIGPPLTLRSGLISVLAAGTEGTTARHEVTVARQQPEGSLGLFVGPRTIGVSQQSMAVVAARDGYGNPAADQTAVALTTQADHGDVAGQAHPLQRGLAVFWLSGAQRPGALEVAAAAGRQFSQQVGVQVQPGPPNPPRLALVGDQSLVADGRTFVDITSQPVVDSTGAVLPDGTSVSLWVDGPAGVGIVAATIRGGKVDALLPAPDRPGVLAVQATIHGVLGDRLLVHFGPAVAPFTVDVDTRAGETTVRIGPVLTQAGGLVLDGTVALVGGRPIVLVNGVAEVGLARLDHLGPGDELWVSVLGVQKLVVL